MRRAVVGAISVGLLGVIGLVLALAAGFGLLLFLRFRGLLRGFGRRIARPGRNVALLAALAVRIVVHVEARAFEDDPHRLNHTPDLAAALAALLQRLIRDPLGHFVLDFAVAAAIVIGRHDDIPSRCH